MLFFKVENFRTIEESLISRRQRNPEISLKQYESYKGDIYNICAKDSRTTFMIYLRN